MSKAILVMDMPERCLNCNCVGHINRNGKFNVCRITGEILKEYDYYKQRPNNCPLRELPEKKEVCGKYPQEDKIVPSYKIGYNACIDEIMKGVEENG